METHEKTSLLKNVDFLKFFHDSTLERLAEESREIPLEPGEVLFKEGTPGDTMYLVLSGEIQIFKNEKLLASLGCGKYFGEMAIIETKPRSATAKAENPAILLEINHQQFKKYFAAHPQSLMAILKTLSARNRKTYSPKILSQQLKNEQGVLEEALGGLLDGTSKEIVIIDPESLDIIHANAGVLNDLELTLDEIKKKTFPDLCEEFPKDKFAVITDSILTGGQSVVTFETSLIGRDNIPFAAEIRLQLSHFNDQRVFLALVQDVSERKQVEETIQQMAYYDPLTGLPNRNLLYDRITLALAQAQRSKTMAGIMFLDLDHFKKVNDSMGHEAGDILLQEVASRLTKILREEDTVARMGGDEFIVLAPSIKHPMNVCALAEKVLDIFKQPISISGTDVFVGVSIGVAIFPNDGKDVAALLKNADLAMYRAKEKGRNNYQLFTVSMHDRARQRMELEARLRQSLERDEFILHYQPKVDMQTHRIVGFEGLARLKDPVKGHISPQDFIPVAEDTRLIIPIGEQILRKGCRQLKIWENMGFGDLHLAINLSVLQFNQPNILELLESIVEEAQIKPQNLELELTESHLMEQREFTINTLNRMNEIGFQLTIDDFGTGYSCLTYLQTLPIGALKIDRSFVVGESTNDSNKAITKAIVAMAKSLNLQTVAEGTETLEQVEFLQGIGCDMAQGFYFSKPRPAEEIEKLLKDGIPLGGKNG